MVLAIKLSLELAIIGYESLLCNLWRCLFITKITHDRSQNVTKPKSNILYTHSLSNDIQPIIIQLLMWPESHLKVKEYKLVINILTEQGHAIFVILFSKVRP